ncbi:MAG TPA: PTS sugar transporter subunit IIA [Longimicrobiales bacterium]|nr:PTS sugar transporter subunit IIA [Longimicrobiales bacterium]
MAIDLRDFIDASAIDLHLEGESKDDVLRELVALLGVEQNSADALFKMLRRREKLGSTGIGNGLAIPHCRSLSVDRLRVAFARKPAGVDFRAVDGEPVRFFFLIVAPPLEVSNQYLPVLGRIAQFAKHPDTTRRLDELDTPEAFLELLGETV